MTEDHVKVLERFISEHKCGFVVAAIRALLEENERLAERLKEIEADGPDHLTLTERRFMDACLSKADRAEHLQRQARARIDAALALHREIQGYCRACGGYWPCSTTKMLRGEK